MKVSAVIPAYNEEDRIADTVGALLAIRQIDEVIVVDDGSLDGTPLRAKEAGANLVISLKQNTGKWEALGQGVRAAAGGILCLCDADLGATAGEFSRLLAPVLAGEADMVVAAFPRSKRRAGFGLVKGLASRGIRLLTGISVQAPLSGQRVLRREVWEASGAAGMGFGVEVGLTVACLRSGYRMVEMPVKMRHRETCRDLSGFLHRGRQFIEVCRTLWQVWRRKARL